MEPRRLQLADYRKRRRGVNRIQKHQRPFVVEPKKPVAPIILE